MPFTHQFRPSHKEIKRYYEELAGYATHEIAHEGATSTAFQTLLAATCKKADWHLVPQLATKIRGKNVRPDGTLRDEFNLHHGYWEAKDSSDKLDVEIRKKIALGYPLTNTIFEDTRTAVLFQKGKETEPRYDLAQPQDLCDLLNSFYSHIEPDVAKFDQAVVEFSERVPEVALALKAKIEDAHKHNKKFQAAYETFFNLCRQSLNPNLSEAAVDEMLIQHLLTIRLFDTIFDAPDFVRRNVIAAEVEKVIDALTIKAISREQFLKPLDRFYVAIERAAGSLGEDFAEKQHFLNTVYERFFQGYSVKVADTHGIVYTPQEIVDFMCASVEEVLKTEFGKTLGSKEVHILDPCTGTGNFIVNLIRRVPKKDLARVYREQLFANEVMLLPYYIAALNIEHAYYERSGEYEGFEGLCFVDTLDLADASQRQLGFMTEENTKRVSRQKKTPITVVIGNPPYNANQLNENDNNKNRKYPVVNERIKETYVKATTATKTKCYDPYVQFFRWATDRIGKRDGILCFVSNNSFVHQSACDGLRIMLPREFTRVYHLDLQGNVRQNPTLSGSAYNVFGIQVGVGITLAIRRVEHPTKKIAYSSVPLLARRQEKLALLEKSESIKSVGWTRVQPNSSGLWFTGQSDDVFQNFVPIGSKAAKKANGSIKEHVLFTSYSLGISTNRDSVVYDFQRAHLLDRVEEFCDAYNSEVARYSRNKWTIKNLDEFLQSGKIDWSRNLKRHLSRHRKLNFDEKNLQISMYRPFTLKNVYLAELAVDELGLTPTYLPTRDSHKDNVLIIAPTVGCERGFFSFGVREIPNLNFVGFGGGGQCFPFYVYNEDGTNRRENITDWALAHFRDHYQDKKITKWDIFYYVYGILHHPGYRTKFADNLKRELPRVPLASDFKAFAKAGKKLADLHLTYENLEEWPLEWIETEGVPLSYEVEKMRLSKDKTQLKVNESLTLAKIPPEVFNYRLGNRSALDWVIDQYQKSTDKRSGIESDPNNPDDEEYIVRLVGQVVRVSVETVKIVEGLPEDYGAKG